MSELENALVLEFPLRGEWNVPTTPGTKIPSHGTDLLGQRYAFDFWQIDGKINKRKFYPFSKIKYWLRGVPLEKCLCWGKDIYAPCDGKIVKIEDGCKERNPVFFPRDMFVALKNAFTANPEKHGWLSYLGNYIIMEIAESKYAFFAHLQNGSITVKIGDEINKGQILGKVGHSGNSTAPHLHFHIMDNIDFFKAKGIPCVFKRYEILKDGRWEQVNNGVPTDKDIIRYNGHQ